MTQAISFPIEPN